MNRNLGRTMIASMILILGFSIASLSQETGVGRSVAVSLDAGEEILWGESTVSLSTAMDEIVLVLSKGAKGPYFAFRDGKKSGPFSKAEEAMSLAFKGREKPSGGRRDCASYKPGDEPEGSGPTMTPADQDSVMIGYAGKTAGPFLIVIGTRVTPDAARLYYMASNKDRAWFGSSDGRRVSFGGMPVEFKFSPDGKNAAVIVEGTATMADMENMGKLPPDKLNAAIKDMEKRFLFTIDGEKYGPFGNNFDSGDFWYPAAGNDLYFKDGGQLFRNGKPFLRADSLDPCAFYPGPDGKSHAFVTYENIVFSDGVKYPSPLAVAVYAEKGKTVFKWLALENKKDLVIFRRTM